MTILEAKEVTRALLDEHGLTDWTVKINSRLQTTAGRCCLTRKQIELGGFHVRNWTDKQLTDLIRHEVAHAMAGPGHGHDKVWKEMAVKLGAKPERCYNSKTHATPKKVLRRYFWRYSNQRNQLECFPVIRKDGPWVVFEREGKESGDTIGRFSSLSRNDCLLKSISALRHNIQDYEWCAEQERASLAAAEKLLAETR